MKSIRTLLISLISFSACILSSCGNFFAPDFLSSSEPISSSEPGSSEEDPVRLTLTVQYKSMGYVTGGGLYQRGSMAHIEAIPYEGYEFVEWRTMNNGSFSTQAALDIRLSSDLELKAVFTTMTRYFTITLHSNNDKWGYVTGSGTYPEGRNLTISAVPYSGYLFSHWQDSNGTIISYSTSYTFTVVETTDLYAHFYIEEVTPTYKVELYTNNSEWGTVIGSGTYQEGTSLKVSAVPNSGYIFSKWEIYNNGDVVSYDADYTFVVTEDISLVAIFDIEEVPAIEHTVYLSSNNPSWGSVSGSGTYQEGTHLTIQATANEGYAFSKWVYYSDGNLFSRYAQTSLYVNEDISLVAIFEEIECTVTFSNTGDSVIPSQTVKYGQLIARPVDPTWEGHTFYRWEYYMGKDWFVWDFNTNVVTGNITLYAKWNTVSYSINVSSIDSSLGYVTGGGTFNYGTEVTLESYPYSSYLFDGWYDSNGALVSNDNPYIFNVTSSVTYVAHFSRVSDRVKVIYDENICSIDYQVTGDSVTLTCNVDSGYKFKGWYSDSNRNVLLSDESSLILFIPKTQVTIYAECERLSDEELVNYYNFSLNSDEQSYTVTGFSGEGLRHAIIPSAYNGLPVTMIGENAFSSLESIKTVFLPDSIRKINYNAFYGSRFTNIRLSNNLEYIESGAFIYCFGLNTITIPASVIDISDGAFSQNALTEINVDSQNNHYTSIDGVLFNNSCTKLLCYPSGRLNSSYSVPSGVTEIGELAFISNNYLEAIDLPNTLKIIGNNNFFNLYNLRSIVLPDSVTTIGSSVFAHCKRLQSINIPASVSSIDILCFSDCEFLTEIIADQNNQYYSSIDGVLFNKDVTTLITYPAGKTDYIYTLPETVKCIGPNAFEYCKYLATINLPYGLTEISNGAFLGCTSLTSILIPDTVTTIALQAFSGCTALETIVIPASVTYVGAYAFENCSNLTIYCEATSQPDWWENNWNYTNCPVVWGYEGH